MRRPLRALLHAALGAVAVPAYALVVVPVARAKAAWKRRRGRPPRVLWGPIPIINIRYAALAGRLQGIPSETLVFDVYSINAREAFDHVLDRFARVPVLRSAVPYAAFLWAGLRYDIFCFYFDGGLLHATPFWRVELALLRLAGRKIVVVPYGGDARLPSATRRLGGWHIYADVPAGAEDRDEAAVRARLHAFDRYADVMLGCADLVADLPRVDGVLRYPYDAPEVRLPAGASPPVVTIAHAPNHRHYKGTRFLLDAVAQLRAEGLPVELDLIERVPNDEARRRVAAADVVADQFLAGAYALLAIEGMSAGRPVVCYLDERLYPWHPEWAECPIVSASPDELPAALRRLVTDARLRDELGARGRDYVRRFHSLESVGRDLADVYRRLWA